ncbi:MAG: AbgT family transporter [Acidobacteria bacterium]|nr:AbgT family transporter [Acidobacteriota bacterium]
MNPLPPRPSTPSAPSCSPGAPPLRAPRPAPQIRPGFHDSPARIVTPVSPYFSFSVAAFVRHGRSSGVGARLSLTLPHSLGFLAICILRLFVSHATGLPLGI